MKKKGPLRSVSWLSKDADEISRGFSDTIWPVKVRPIDSKSTIEVEFDFAHCQNIKVWRGKCASGMNIGLLNPPPSFTFHLPVSGRVSFSQGSKEFSADQNVGAITFAQQLGMLRYSVEFDNFAVAVVGKCLENRLENLLDSPLKTRLRYDERFATSGASAEMLRSLLQVLVEDERDALSENPFTAATISETILTLLVEGFSHNYSDALKGAAIWSRKSVAPRYIKRAIDFINADVVRPLSIPEIAEKSNISIRSLQYAFRNFTGMSPANYVKMVRLDRAIEEIRNASPDIAIAEIASRWGFSKPARFASLCVKRTGVKPSELRRRR